MSRAVQTIIVLYLHTPLQYAVIYYTRNIPRKILILLALFLVIRFHTPPQYLCSILPNITVFAVLLFLSYSRIVIFEARKLVIFL